MTNKSVSDLFIELNASAYNCICLTTCAIPLLLVIDKFWTSPESIRKSGFNDKISFNY